MCEICENWCRVISLKVKSKDGIPLVPNHHERCPKYNDSLIDVWKGQLGKTFYYCENEGDARDSIGEEGTVTKEKMHREIFENLPEFEGF